MQMQREEGVALTTEELFVGVFGEDMPPREVPQTVPTCAGEWRHEGNGYWGFWRPMTERAEACG